MPKRKGEKRRQQAGEAIGQRWSQRRQQSSGTHSLSLQARRMQGSDDELRGGDIEAAPQALQEWQSTPSFDDQVTGVVDQECPPGSPGAEFEAQLRELLEPDQLEPASRVLQVEVHEMFESEPALW